MKSQSNPTTRAANLIVRLPIRDQTQLAVRCLRTIQEFCSRGLTAEQRTSIDGALAEIESGRTEIAPFAMDIQNAVRGASDVENAPAYYFSVGVQYLTRNFVQGVDGSHKYLTAAPAVEAAFEAVTSGPYSVRDFLLPDGVTEFWQVQAHRVELFNALADLVNRALGNREVSPAVLKDKPAPELPQPGAPPQQPSEAVDPSESEFIDIRFDPSFSSIELQTLIRAYGDHFRVCGGTGFQVKVDFDRATAEACVGS